MMERDCSLLIHKILFIKHAQFYTLLGYHRYFFILSYIQDQFKSYNDRLIVPLYTNCERDVIVANLLVPCPAEEKPAWIISNIAFLLEK